MRNANPAQGRAHGMGSLGKTDSRKEYSTPTTIAEFLSFITGGQGRIHLSAIKPDGCIAGKVFADYRAAEEWALEQNQAGSNIYYTANIVRRGFNGNKPSKRDIEGVREWYADVDPHPEIFGGDYAAARHHLLDVILPEISNASPTVVIDSGNGLQAHWCAIHPFGLPEGEREAYEDLNAKVGQRFHGPGTQNCDRLLRVPFTKNYPNEAKLKKGYPRDPTTATIIAFTGKRYTSDEVSVLANGGGDAKAHQRQEERRGLRDNYRELFEQFLAAKANARKRWEGSTEGLTDTSGSAMDLSMAAMLKGAGFSRDEMEGILADWPHGSEGGKQQQGARYFDRLWERCGQGTDDSKSQERDSETIARLAALPILEYSRIRKEEAGRLGVRVTDLDAEVKRAREGAKVDLGAALPAGKGQGLNVAEAEPWSDPIDLNEVLNELVTEIKRYVVLSAHADTAIALWVAHSYVYNAGDISPFLFLTSPLKRCGKSTAMIFLLGVVNRPMVASNISPSSIFRVIEACQPTLLIDEADTFFNKNEELRGVMNSGHTKPLAYVIRTVDIGGGVFEPRQFSTWAPKAVAGIRRLADTLEDRSIIVELKRKLPGEHTERIAKFNGDTIRRKLTRWARDNFEAIKCADPQLPPGVYNRLADNWLPLLAIAELAGTEWTGRALKALLAGMDNDSRTDSAGVMLLSDLRALFNERRDPAYLATRDILEHLHERDDRPWPAFGKFPKPITREGIAKLLEPFKIKPGQINEINTRGYYLNDLKDAFDRYIPKKTPLTPILGGTNLHTCINLDEMLVTENPNLHKVNQENAGTDPPEGAPDKKVCRYASRKGGDRSERDIALTEAQKTGVEIPCEPFPTPAYKLISSYTELEAYQAGILSSKVVGVDSETTGLDCHTHTVRLVQLATPDQVLVVDVAKVPVEALAPVFDGGRKLVFHNAKFDLKFLVKNGITLPTGNSLFDTMLASQLLSAGLPEGQLRESSLAKVAERYLSIQLDKSLQGSDWFGDLFVDQLAYAARDAAVLLPLRESLRGRLLKDGLKVVTSIEFRCVPALALMELIGVPIDVKAWIARGDEENRRVIELEKRLDHAAGQQINWSSPEQVLQLFKERGHNVNRTNEAVLHQLAVKDPVAALLLEHREASKWAGTYGSDWVAKHVNQVTGRVHPDFLQLGCSTGRMSCTKPNMQNIPRGPRLRCAIRANSGKRLIKADISQVELRIAAVLSGDTAMLAAYERGEDLHVATAGRLLNVSHDAVTKEQRQLAKAVNFGFVYGMGTKTFQTYAQSMFGLNITEVEAERYRRTFFRIYPGLRKWHRSIEDGTVDTRTLTGRVRHGVFRFTDKLNTPDQGTGADGLKLALARLYEDRIGHGSPVLAIHDEIVLEALDAGDAEWLVRHMMEAMSEVLGHRCPIVVNNTIGEQWS